MRPVFVLHQNYLWVQIYCKIKRGRGRNGRDLNSGDEAGRESVRERRDNKESVRDDREGESKEGGRERRTGERERGGECKINGLSWLQLNT